MSSVFSGGAYESGDDGTNAGDEPDEEISDLEDDELEVDDDEDGYSE